MSLPSRSTVVASALMLLASIGCTGGGGKSRKAALLEGVPVIEEIRVPGLGGPVDAVRDVHGIHHIYPREHTLDGAFANGYLLIPIRQAGALTAENPPWLPLPGTGGFEWEKDAEGRPIFNLPSARAGAEPAPGWPRAGGIETVDPANFAPGLPFEPGSGPNMRHVIEMAPGGTVARNVLPGGQNDLNPSAGLFDPVEIDPSIHYGDGIPLWIENRRREQWIRIEDVVENAEGRIRLLP